MSKRTSWFVSTQRNTIGRSGGQWQRSVPSLYVSPTGTISVLLRDDVVIEMTAAGNIRTVVNEKFSAAISKDGSVASIMHPHTRIFKENRKFYCQFGGDWLAVLGFEGIIFSSKRLQEALLVSSTTVNGAKIIPLSMVRYPSLGTDFTLSPLFCRSAGSASEAEISECEKIVQEAHYEIQESETIVIHVNGFFIRQEKNGNVAVICPPRKIHVCPDASVTVKDQDIVMGIQEEESFVKWGTKRVHSSRTRMVVSDGIYTASMDRFGRLLSS